MRCTDDTIIMICMLKMAFSGHTVATNKGFSCQFTVFIAEL